jgi:YfiH family protein
MGGWQIMLWPMQADVFDWIVPDWPAPAAVRACCSTRSGGVSEGRYASLNLGLHVGDDPGHVHLNRTRLQAQMGARAVFLDQVHGTDMLKLASQSADGMPADGAFTSQTGLACTVMVADCLPVLMCDTKGRQVAAAHAGWRGLLGVHGRGVLENAAATFDANCTDAGSLARSTLLAWLGPCIGPKAFEVGDEVRAAFVAATPSAAFCFMPGAPGKWWADLPGLAWQRLAAMGIARTFGNDGSDAWCTATHASRFFSHRRDGVSGRQAACIWRVN